MADESSLVKLLAQKFKLLAPGQVKQAIETLPPGQKPAGVAGAVVANPNNSKKLFEEFPLQLAKALKLLLTKGTPLEERSKTEVATAALTSAAAYAKNASSSASSALRNVWETIKCAYSQLPSLAILKKASVRVPIWSERYGQVNIKLIDSLVEIHGANKARELLNKIKSHGVPRSNWSRKPITPATIARARNAGEKAFKSIEEAGGSVASAARAARNATFDQLVKTGMSAGRAAEAAKELLKPNKDRITWSRKSVSNDTKKAAREAFNRVKAAGGSVASAVRAARNATFDQLVKTGMSAGRAAEAAKELLKPNKGRITWSRKDISDDTKKAAQEAAREAFERVKKAGGTVAEAVEAARKSGTKKPVDSGAREPLSRTPPIKKSPFNISGIMGGFATIAKMARTAKSKANLRQGLAELKRSGVSPPWIGAIEIRLRNAKNNAAVSQIARNFANKVEQLSLGNSGRMMVPPIAPVPGNGAPAPPPLNKWLEDSKNMNRKSIQNLVKLRRNYPARKSDINRFLGEKVEKLISNSGRSGTSSIKEVLRLMKNVPNLPGKDRVFDLIEQRIQDIEYDARNNPVTAKERLRRFKSSIGYSGGLFGNRNLGRIFSNAEREYNRKIADNRRRKMNENRNRRGLAPLPAPNRRPNNYAAPRGNMGGVFRPPPNQPVPNLRAPNMAPPMNMGPPLNMGEIKAINNVGGPNKALNLVQNAGGSNEVLRAANQLKEAGGSPELAVAKGANVKNIKIVLQLGGANNAAKVATAAPKLRRRKRSKKVKKTKGKGRPKISAIKKLLRSLPKKKLLAVLPKSNKASMANKNKANVATRVTSYLSGRTKKK